MLMILERERESESRKLRNRDIAHMEESQKSLRR
jgi:hypothetical protein